MARNNQDVSWVDFLARNINGTRLFGISPDGDREAEQVWRPVGSATPVPLLCRRREKCRRDGCR